MGRDERSLSSTKLERLKDSMNRAIPGVRKRKENRKETEAFE